MSEASIRAAKKKEHESKEYKAMRAKRKAEAAAHRSARIEAKLRRDLERTLKSIDEMKNPKTPLQKKRSTEAGTLRELIARRDAVKEQLKKIAGKQGGDIGETKVKLRGNPVAGGDVDSGAFEGEEARRDKKKKTMLDDKKKEKGPRTDKDKKGGNIGNIDMKDFKSKKKEETKKKKKKTMLGSNPYGAGKGRYGDIKPGVYKGQR